MTQKNLFQFIYWGLFYAFWWSLYGTLIFLVLYAQKEGIELDTNSTEYKMLFAHVIKYWAIGGFIIGFLSLIALVNLSDLVASSMISPVHTFNVTGIAAIVGIAICTYFYNGLVLPEGLYLKSYFWRVPAGFIAAVIATGYCLNKQHKKYGLINDENESGGGFGYGRCLRCRGTGRITEGHGGVEWYRMEKPCPSCGGRGIR